MHYLVVETMECNDYMYYAIDIIFVCNELAIADSTETIRLSHNHQV